MHAIHTVCKYGSIIYVVEKGKLRCVIRVIRQVSYYKKVNTVLANRFSQLICNSQLCNDPK